MPQPPEIVHESATPPEILARLDLLKERYRTGLMDAAAFNDALKAFQFTDEIGHLWAPGVNSTRWYRWDRTEWTAADPPARLNLPGMPIMFERGGIDGSAGAARQSSQPEGAPQAPPSSGKSRRPQPKASVPSPAARIAASVTPAPPPPPFAPPPTAPQLVQPAPAASAGPKFCPQCGAPAAGKKFCSKCGRKLG